MGKERESVDSERKKDRLLRKVNAQCNEKLNKKLSRVFEIGSEEVRKKKDKLS